MDTHPNPHALAKQHVARILVDLRTAAGLTQSQLARRLGWTNSVASRIESSQGGLPDLTSVARYAGACDLRAVLVFASSSADQRLHHAHGHFSNTTALDARMNAVIHEGDLPLDDAPGDTQGMRIHSVVSLQATRHTGFYQRFDPETLFNFARALRATRNAVAISQIELARRARWTPQFVSRLETSLCARVPNFASLIRYTAACRVDAGLLFTTPHLGAPDIATSEVATLDIATFVIVSAISLQPSDHPVWFEALAGRRFILPLRNIRASSVRIGPLP